MAMWLYRSKSVLSLKFGNISRDTNKWLFTEHYVIRTDPSDTVIYSDRLSSRFIRKIFDVYYSDNMTSVQECDVAVLVR